MRLLIAICLLSIPLSASDIYFASASAGSNNGTSCANAYAYNDGTHGVNIVGNWVAGNTLHICGTISVAASTNIITAQGSGSSGNPITVKFESGAILASPVFGTGSSAGIVLSNKSWIVVDGGNTSSATGTWNSDGTITSAAARTGGMIFNYANGSAGQSNCPGAALTFTQSCTQQSANDTVIEAIGVNNVTIENLGPCYGAIITGGSFGNGAPGQDCIHFQGSNVTITNNQLWYDGNGIDNTGWVNGDTNTVISNDDFKENGWALGCAGGAGSNTNYQFLSNHVYNANQWAGTGTHINGIHCYDGSSGGIQSFYLINNVFDGTMASSAWTTWVYLESNSTTDTWSGNTGALYAVGNVLHDTTGLGNGLIQTGGGVNHFIAYNVFWGCQGALCSAGSGSVNKCLQTGGTGMTVVGNAFIQCGQVTFADNHSGQTPSLTQWDYNVYGTAQTGTSNFQFNAITQNTLSGWQTACSCDAHSVSGNNALTTALSNITAEGTPSAGYIGLAIGLNESSLATGLLSALSSDTSAGNTRTPLSRPSSSNWDVGAYQFSAAVVTPAPALGMFAELQ